MGIPYGLALTIASIGLVVVYAADSSASVVGRVSVALLLVAAFYVPGGFWWEVLSVLLKLGVSIGLLCRLSLGR